PGGAGAAGCRFLRLKEGGGGRWHVGAHRPPIESSDVQVTALSMRMLQIYAPKTERQAFQAPVDRAAAWLRQAQPSETESQAFRLLGLAWSRAPRRTVLEASAALAAGQRPDGGWAQLPTLESDAYATGQALVALRESGAMAAGNPVIARGVGYLLRTQLGDGSWHVQSRAIAIQ